MPHYSMAALEAAIQGQMHNLSLRLLDGRVKPGHGVRESVEGVLQDWGARGKDGAQ
jgi:hypothetical protein